VNFHNFTPLFSLFLLPYVQVEFYFVGVSLPCEIVVTIASRHHYPRKEEREYVSDVDTVMCVERPQSFRRPCP